MIIKDMVALAKYSELRGVSAKDDINIIVAFVNLGMLELYKRFPIKVEQHTITLEDGVYYYEMPENFMYPLEAFGEVPEGASGPNPIGINGEEGEQSVYFNDWNTVQIPGDLKGGFVSITYVASPANISTEQAEDGTTKLELPDTLVDCLLHYIGYKAQLGVKADAQAENNAHWARFERSCKKASDLGVSHPTDNMSMSGRINSRGFV